MSWRFQQIAFGLLACGLAVGNLNLRPAAHAFADHYVPLGLAQHKPFPVTTVGQIGAGSPLRTWPAGLGQIKVSLDDEVFQLSGQSQYKSYRIRLAPRSYSVYRADFDKNGSEDFVLAYDTMGNGLAPSSHLLFVLFDAQGEPFPFAADGYFDYNARGIADLVDLNQDGKAELIYMSYDKHYWVTQTYQAQAGRWQRVQSLTGSQLRFPLYTAFTHRPNHQSVTPTGSLPFGPNLSNQHPMLSGQVRQVVWAEVSQSEDITLKIQTPQGQQSCQPVSWYSTFSVVLDDARSRRIAFLSAEPATQQLLQEAEQGAYQATLYGQRTPENCSPEVLWAK